MKPDWIADFQVEQLGRMAAIDCDFEKTSGPNEAESSAWRGLLVELFEPDRLLTSANRNL